MMTHSQSPVLDAAWQRYLVDHDQDSLLEVAKEEQQRLRSSHPALPPEHTVFHLLLWRALSVEAWQLVKTLEARQITIQEEEGAPALYQAVDYFGDAPKAIAWLLDRGARIDAVGINDWTALHFACNRGYLGVVAMLVLRGADVNKATSCDGGYTPLMEACAAGKKAIVEFLLAHGADPTVWNSLEGGTARDIARLRGHPEIAELLDAWSAKNKRHQEKVSKKMRRKRDSQGKKRGRENNGVSS